MMATLPVNSPVKASRRPQDRVWRVGWYPKTSNTLKATQRAVGEGLPVFVARAVRHKRGGQGNKKPRTRSPRLDIEASVAYNKHRKGAATSG